MKYLLVDSLTRVTNQFAVTVPERTGQQHYRDDERVDGIDCRDQQTPKRLARQE